MTVQDKGLSRGEGDTAVTVARALGLSVRSVQRLVSEAGMPGKIGPGRYDLRVVVAWFIDREVERRMGRGVDLDRLIERLRGGVNPGAIRAAGDSGRARR